MQRAVAQRLGCTLDLADRHDDGSLGFEPDPDLPVWDAGLVDGAVRWRRHD